MVSSVKDAHLHIENEDSKTEKPGIWSASFAFGAVRRSTGVDEVCRCHARPAERSGLLARSPREIISTCWSHPSTASAPTSHDVHEGGWTSERLWSMRCTGRLCSHCGWQSDPARSTASQRATLTGRVAPESPMLTVRASLSVCRCHGPVIWTALRGHVACSARSSAWPACTGAHRPQPQRWFIARWP